MTATGSELPPIGHCHCTDQAMSRQDLLLLRWPSATSILVIVVHHEPPKHTKNLATALLPQHYKTLCCNHELHHEIHNNFQTALHLSDPWFSLPCHTHGTSMANARAKRSGPTVVNLCHQSPPVHDQSHPGIPSLGMPVAHPLPPRPNDP